MSETRRGEDLSELLTPKQAAAALNISVFTLRDYANAGKIPCVRTPAGHRRFTREAINQVLGINTKEVFAFYARSSAENKKRLLGAAQEKLAAPNE